MEPSAGLDFARNCFKVSRLYEEMPWQDLRKLPQATLEAHRAEVWEATTRLRGLPIRKYRGYSGPWLENRWIETFSKLPQKAFGGLVPVFAQWFDAYHGNKYPRTLPTGVKIPPLRQLLQALGKVIRSDFAYVTVSDHDHGIFHFLARPYDNRLQIPLSRLLVLSSGGVGHVPLPLLKQPEAVLPHRKHSPSVVLSFKGGLDGMRPARTAMVQELLQSTALSSEQRRQVRIESMAIRHTPRIDASTAATSGLHSLETSHSTQNEQILRAQPSTDNSTAGGWRHQMQQSAFVLTPRGQARNSYFVWETLQMGLLPVYVWDDHEWLPYRGSTHADFELFGFSVRLGTFKLRAREIWDAALSPSDLRRRRRRALSLRASHFTLEGTIDQIAKLLANGTTGPGSSDLRCLAGAPLGGPHCHRWRDNFYQTGTTDCAPQWYPQSSQNVSNLTYPWTLWDATRKHAAFTFKEYSNLVRQVPGCAASQMLPGCAASRQVKPTARFPGFIAAMHRAGRGNEILNDSDAGGWLEGPVVIETNFKKLSAFQQG